MLRKLLIVAILAVVMLAPSAVSAASPLGFFPIVQCGTQAHPTPCTPCGLFEAADNVINLILFGITGPLAIFTIVIAGGMFLLSAGDPGKIAEAKKLLTRTFMGIAIILVSWVATTFLIKTLSTTDSDTGPWYEFTCPQFLEDAGQQPDAPAVRASQGTAQKPNAQVVNAIKVSCDAPALAAKYGQPSSDTKRESPTLKTLMSCIERDPVAKALIDPAQKFTYDRNNPLCNLTHGERICSSCSHAVGSCHYGGKTGTDGAEAVDYNWNHKTINYDKDTRQIVASCDGIKNCRRVGSEQDLFDEVYRAAIKNSCAFKFLNFEGDHTHVSTLSCDGDGKGIKGRSVPKL